MKNSLKSLVAVLVVAMMVFSLSSCSVFQAMRDAANNVEETTIYADPVENEVISSFNGALTNSIKSADSIDYSNSYSAGSIDILTAEGEDAGILDDAASQLKKMVMSSKPGSESGTLENNDTTDTLLGVIDEANILSFTYTRNYASEAVTDENGDEVTDEDGNTVTVEYVSDNILNLLVNYYKDYTVDAEWNEADTTEADETVVDETEADTTEADETVVDETEADTTEADETEADTTETDTTETDTTEADTTETDTTEDATVTEETTVAEETTRVYADTEIIEVVFGTQADKDAVIAQFDCIKDYLVLNDYDIAYTECNIKSEYNLETGLVDYVTFTKGMTVTASVTGVGVLASYGDLTVTLNLTKTANYTFNYPSAEDTTAE